MPAPYPNSAKFPRESELPSVRQVRALVRCLPSVSSVRGLVRSIVLGGIAQPRQRTFPLALVLLTIFGATASVRAEVSLPIPWTEQHQFTSVFTSRQYLVQVGLPRNYDPINRRYPVIYQTDGHAHFAKTLMISRALEYDHAIPPSIVVGITYAGNDPDYASLRIRDLTPLPISGLSESGHADKFLNTIKSEVIPLIERNYPVDTSQRILMGSSFGGLFTAYALLYSPQTFTGYVISSPSFWQENFHFVEAVASRGGNLNGRGIKARINTGASESERHREGAQRFYDALLALNLNDFDLELSFAPSERHSAVAQVSYYRFLPEVFQPSLSPLIEAPGDPINWFPTHPSHRHTVDKVTRVVSNTTGFPNKLLIEQPAGDSNSGTARGVMYLLDAQWDLHLAFSSYQTMVSDSELTNLTRVGIEWEGSSTDVLRRRDHDLTPTDPDGNGDFGGATDFQALMRDQLIPAAEAELTVNRGYRILMASEKAGLWGLQDLLSENPLFDRYLLVSPSVNWDNEWILALEAQRAASSAPLNAKVRIYTGSREKTSPAVVNFVQRLKSRQHSGLDVEVIQLDDAGYAQAKLIGYHKGLRLLGR